MHSFADFINICALNISLKAIWTRALQDSGINWHNQCWPDGTMSQFFIHKLDILTECSGKWTGQAILILELQSEKKYKSISVSIAQSKEFNDTIFMAAMHWTARKKQAFHEIQKKMITIS